MSGLYGVPLEVRVVGDDVDRHITGQLRDLTYRSTAVGGFASASFTLDRPIRVDAPELAVLNKLYVYDRRSAETMWQGYLEDPGRSAGSDGLVWSLSAVGSAGRAQDQFNTPSYVDMSLGKWQRIPSSTIFLVTEQDSATQGWKMGFPRGNVVVVSDHGGLQYVAFAEAGMKVARVSYSYTPGNADVRWRHKIQVENGGVTTASDIGWNSGAGSVSKVVVTDWPNGRDVAMFRHQLNTSNITITDDVSYVTLNNITVRGMLLNKDGTDKTTGYTTDTVLASEVVADVVARMCPAFDGATATIDTTSYAIDQLAYPDGATAADIWADLMTLEPAYRWAAWEDTANGKHRFEWTAWPTSVRYEADVSAGFSAPESSMNLYDSVLVRWTDVDGVTRPMILSQSVPALQGIARRGFVDLGSAVGSPANAARAGQEFLDEHAVATNAGHLTIAGPILDTVAARMVLPQQIRPGNLIRVHGINARPDALNPVQNGTTVFRIAATEYKAGDNTCVLELDSYSPSLARAIADVRSKQGSVRRG